MSELDDSSRDVLAAFGDLRPHDVLGGHELLLPAGRGGMALVWLARPLGASADAAPVALKTMLPALGADPRFEKMFLAEGRLASRIRHPNVCEVLGVGEDAGRLYLVMEWIRGESLSALAKNAGAPIRYGVAARIALDVARGLGAAHALVDEEGQPLGVVHRDVSPHNVMVGEDGVSKVVDFGVSKAGTGEGLTQSGYTKGKVEYMSPEQAFCERVDARTDVFALGVVLYEVTIGRHPFKGETQLATLASLTTVDPPVPAEICPDYPPALAAIVAKAMEKDKDDRYASMAELERALAAFVSTETHATHTDVAAFLARVEPPSAKRRAEALERALRGAPSRDAFAARGRRANDGRRQARPSRARWSLVGAAVVAVAGGTIAWRLGQGSAIATQDPALASRLQAPATIPAASARESEVGAPLGDVAPATATVQAAEPPPSTTLASTRTVARSVPPPRPAPAPGPLPASAAPAAAKPPSPAPPPATSDPVWGRRE